MLSLPDDEFRARVVEHLAAHDAAITENTRITCKVEEDTAFIRSILSDVAAGARLMCRLADAWRFLLRQVFVPVVLPIGILYGIWCIHAGRAVPAALADMFHLLVTVH